MVALKGSVGREERSEFSFNSGCDEVGALGRDTGKRDSALAFFDERELRERSVHLSMDEQIDNATSKRTTPAKQPINMIQVEANIEPNTDSIRIIKPLHKLSKKSGILRFLPLEKLDHPDRLARYLVLNKPARPV